MSNVIVICGLKNSGKTTLINSLVDAYHQKGLKVAVIKHDGHDFECDRPNTDTNSFTNHGAYGVACFSNNRMFVHRIGTNDNEANLLQLFPEADLIFIEGLKNSTYPKIEIIRECISQTPVSTPEGRFLIVSDFPAEKFNERTVDIDDINTIMYYIDQEVNL